MTTFRMIGAAILVMISISFGFMNLTATTENRRARRDGAPPRRRLVPFLSVFAASIAYLVYPENTKLWILAVPTLDIGNWIVILGGLHRRFDVSKRKPGSKRPPHLDASAVRNKD